MNSSSNQPKRKGKSKVQQEPDKRQQKITSFFSAPTSGSCENRQQGNRESPAVELNRDGRRVVLEPFKKKVKAKAANEIAVIDISDSEESSAVCEDATDAGPRAVVTARNDVGERGDAPSLQTEESPACAIEIETGGENEFDDSGDEILSQVNEEEVLSSSQENSSQAINPGQLIKTGGENEFDDSGDEILSQVNEEEVLSSSQENSSQSIINPGQLLVSSQSTSFTVTPVKMPKARVNRFSPLSRLQSSQDKSTSRSKSTSPYFSPTNNKAVTPSIVRRTPPGSSTDGAAGSSFQAGVKKKLFDSNPESQSRSNLPYYLKNFETIVCSVKDDPFHEHLLDERDRSIIERFFLLPVEERCLFVRMFSRKWMWRSLDREKSKYPRIKEDLTSVYEGLHRAGFFIEVRDVLDSLTLQDILSVLNLSQILALAKAMNIVPNKKNMQCCKEALIKLGSQQCGLFGSSKSREDVVKNRAVNLLGPTYQLHGMCRTLFSRLFIMYSPPQYWEDEQEQNLNEMLKILFAEDGRMKFPACKVNKSAVIHKDRDQILRFHEAWSKHCEMAGYTESKDWEEVIRLGEIAAEQLQELLTNDNIMSHDASLPSFLRVYKAGSVWTRIVWLSVEGYQKFKRYQDANEKILLLLKQDKYLTQYRGRWYERLAINQKQLKINFAERKKTLENALTDPFLQDAHKLTLSDRLSKLLDEQKRRTSRPPKKKSKIMDDVDDEDIDEGENVITDLFTLSNSLPTVTIVGEKLFNPNSGKSVFISKQDDGGSTSASSVENFVIAHYKSLGYTFGIHAEGSAVCSIFGLLFWDEIYNDEIHDTFHSPYQAYPLDMNFDEFFTRREGLILDKVQGMKQSWTMDDALQLIEENWGKHFEVLSLVNWTIFSSVDKVKTLVKAMGLDLTAAICERLARNFRHNRSGFPDLVVFNETNYKIVEVKGPNDSLSFKQKVWLDFLLSVNANAEVCLVKDVSNKRIL